MPTRDQRQVKQACVQPNMCWYALRVRNWSDPVWGPVLEDGVTDNVLSGQEAPVVRVEAVVAIIAQHEDRAGRHSHRRQPVLGRLVGERLLLLLAVDKEAPVAHLDDVTLHCHDALDQGLAIGFAVSQLPKELRRVKNDHLAPQRRPHQFADLLDCQLVIDLKCWIHRQRRNVTRLNDEKADREADSESRHEFPSKFSDFALASSKLGEFIG
mmetsp:Transcript_37087/g.81497  ORF Transcript_37087/g.81497 Transcript_37087/m.81497 type:complete len:212 (+) Transcript_37087:122-757(+)